MKNLLSILFFMCFVFTVSTVFASPPGYEVKHKTEFVKLQRINLQTTVTNSIVKAIRTNVTMNFAKKSNLLYATYKPILIINAIVSFKSIIKLPDINNKYIGFNNLHKSNLNFAFYQCNYL